MNLTPHQRIMRAAKRGTGLRLTAKQVFDLSRDDAIRTCAQNDDEGMPYGPSWVSSKVEENERGFGRKS